MRKNVLLLGIAIVYLQANLLSQSITRLDNSKISFGELDRKIEHLMKEAMVEGMAITVFNNNKSVYKKVFGFKRLDTKEPLQTNTNFYGASLSKAVFAVLVMKLVEEGLIDLDKPLQDYLPRAVFDYPPSGKWTEDYNSLKSDPRYKKITARMCLDHTTGFHNWRFFEPDQQLHIHFEPGSRFSYSGEGMCYLQFVIEKKSGKSLEELMIEKVFGPLGMKSSSYTWQPRFEQNYCYGHNMEGKIYEKDKDNFARAPSTLETTPDDYALFVEGVLQQKIINASSTKTMFTPHTRIRTPQQFPVFSTIDSTGNDAIQLSYGLGWVLLQSPYGTGAFKEGHGDGFQHYSIIFPAKKTGITILTNSDKGESIFKELLETAIADTFTPWYWENYIPYNQKKN